MSNTTVFEANIIVLWFHLVCYDYFILKNAQWKSDDEPEAKRKWGVVNEDKYKRNVIRKARVKGEEYTNYKGNLVSGKSIPDELVCNCPRKCSLSIDNETKSAIWNKFYSLETKNQQDLHLQTLIEAREVKRRKKKNSDNDDCSAASFSTQIPQTKSKSFVYNVKTVSYTHLTAVWWFIDKAEGF